jgi:CDP-diacylglycerol--glycerol-3-phosphate 3-phosphatidyltransferase
VFYKSLPNILTLSRIIIIPAIVGSFYLGDNKSARLIASSLFLIASFTDFLDGFIARTWSLQSSLGRFLDPIADKLLVSSIILMLVHFDRVDILPALAIIFREILVSGLREFLASLRVSVPVSELSKLKTAVQMLAIFLLLLGNKGSNFMYTDILGRIALWAAALLTIMTGYAYLKSAIKYIAQDVEQ